MKATGIVRRIDDLGRVVIPKEIRRTMRIREGESLKIYTKYCKQWFQNNLPYIKTHYQVVGQRITTSINRRNHDIANHRRRFLCGGIFVLNYQQFFSKCWGCHSEELMRRRISTNGFIQTIDKILRFAQNDMGFNLPQHLKQNLISLFSLLLYSRLHL